MPAPQRIQELVDKFKLHFDYYQSGEYNEEQLRTEFLNPFFEVLGWDMENRLAKGADRDVHYEKLVHGKAPDFGFYLDKKIRFFVEAKKPALNICNNQDAALQLRGYGWSAKTARSILTDFEEFAIYDTSVRPKNGDTSRIARIDCIKFDEYVDRWDEIVDLFSREKVFGGSLEKLTKKRAQQTVDDELLEDISKWRDLLAHNIANRNEVSEERLNRIVQDTIGRILFLRICEDRGIANEGDLSRVIEGEDNYTKLYKLFRKAEQRYDSDLFEVATIADLKIDDKVLKDVISELYFPKSPYKFDAIPAEILGQVYEQFLGKVIRLTEGGHAKVELKPEVRKAGGIYYTPTYIVEYIVQNTVGKLVEGKTPKQIEKLSIVDPACGSGSFLLGAYKFLADWYRDWYVADDAKKYEKAKKIYRDPAGQWQLTLEERKRVLTAHIYGVDLDRQAVELAKLSLMLEALRSPEQQSLFNDRMLPRLGENIKCGNSLIGPDYFTSQLTIDPIELRRINPFDWDHEFQKIILAGGFDVVLGNPPWGAVIDSEVDWLKERYPISAKSYVDTYKLFTDKAISLMRKNGVLGYITPSSFLIQPRFKDFKEFIYGFDLEVLNLGDGIFQGVTAPCCIVILRNTPSSENEYYDFRSVPRDGLPLIINDPGKLEVSATLKINGEPLEKFFVIKDAGIQYHRSGIGKSKKGGSDLYERIFCTDKEKRFVNTKPTWYGALIDRYYISEDTDELFNLDYKEVLKEKESVTFNKEFFEADEKIIWRQTADKLRAVLDSKQRWFRNTLQGAFVRPEFKQSIDIKYSLAIFNSSLFKYLYNNKVRESGRTFPQVKIGYLKGLPFVVAERRVQQEIIDLVNNLLQLNLSFHTAKNTEDQEVLRRQIDATDRGIDQNVYKLYGLTEDDIRIVEGSSGS